MASIEKRGRYWSVRYRAVDDIGNETNKRVSGFKSRAEAEKAAGTLEPATAAGIDVHGDKQTCGYWMERWFAESCAGRVEATTLSKYSDALDILRETAIYNTQVRNTNRRTLPVLIEVIRTRGGRERTVRTALDTTEPLRFALSWALQSGYLMVNPIAGSRLPAAETPKQVILDDHDMDELVREAATVRVSPNKRTVTGGSFYIPVLLALYGGLRREEAAGLTWDNVDIKRKTITITAVEAATTQGKRVKKAPKTKKSRRTISMPRFVMDALRASPRRSDYVCVRRDGKPLALHSYSKAVARIIEKINKERAERGEAPMPKASYHDLRHTHAAYLIRLGQHPAVIQDRLGHGSIKITMDTYGYLMPGMQEGAAEAMEKAGTKPGTQAGKPTLKLIINGKIDEMKALEK